MSTQELIAAKHDGLRNHERASTPFRSCLDWLLSRPEPHKTIYLAADLFGLTLAHALALRMVGHFLRIPFSAINPYEYHRFYIPFFAVVLYLFEGYKSPELRRPEQELERTCKAVGVSFLGLVLFNFVGFRSQPFSRYLLVAWFFLALVFLVALRFALRACYAAVWQMGLCRRRTLLIGSVAGLTEFQQMLSVQRHHGYDFVGALLHPAEEAAAPPLTPHIPILGTPDDWENAVNASGAHVVVVAYPAFPKDGGGLEKMLRRCKERRVDVEIYSSLLATENLNYEHDEFSGCFRFFSKPAWSLTLQRATKAGIDLVTGILGSTVTLLLIPIIYLLVNLDDPGPLFYRSAYVSQDGSDRFYLKFRTMRRDAEHFLERNPDLRAQFQEKQKLIDDPRVTRFGHFLRKYSIDEFPQFFSILTGQLSLVGPRTIRQEEKGRYGEHLEELLSCKPGLTGFWQVMGRQTTTYPERVQMDMFYLNRWSIWLDLFIVAKTFWKVIRAEGAY